MGRVVRSQQLAIRQRAPYRVGFGRQNTNGNQRGAGVADDQPEVSGKQATVRNAGFEVGAMEKTAISEETNIAIARLPGMASNE